MRIALAQIDSTVADFCGNSDKIIEYTQRAERSFSAELILFPELALCGYPPMDLLDQDSFTVENIRALRSLQRRLPENIAVGIGYVARNDFSEGKALVNAYGVLYEGRLVFQQEKTLLPTYDVFDEERYFESAQARRIFCFKDERIAFAICEDVWRETGIPGTRYNKDPVKEFLDQGATLLCVPIGSKTTFSGVHRKRKQHASFVS